MTEKKALIAVLCIFAGLCVFRAYHLYVTSFFVSDEYRYLRDAFNGTFVEKGVATRFVFTALNASLFQLLHIQTTDAFVIFLPFYLFSWIAISVFFFYKLMKLLEFDEKTIALSLTSSLILVSFTLLSLGFLSEPFALAMAMVGLYCLIWYVKKGDRGIASLITALASILAFALASFSREPYYLFLVGGVVVIIVSTMLKNKTVDNPVSFMIAIPALLTSVALFGVGLVLGWGLLVIFALAGFLILFIKTLQKKDTLHLALLFMSLMALGSYLSVSALAASGGLIGDYLSFQHFSTIIRFTDTANPAYFVLAPFAFSYIAKHKKLTYVSVVSLLLFGAGAIGVYQSYASSNLGLQQNPFSLSYRSGGAMVRDYIVTHPSEAPFHIVGFWTVTWYQTTGTSQVDNRTLDFRMNITQEDFLAQRWSTFYVYGYNLRYPNQTHKSLDYGTSSAMLTALVYFPFDNFSLYPLSPYATPYQIAHSDLPKLPFDVIDRTVIGNATAFLVKFDVQWKSA